jgi:alpha-N-arabinofuranosidase
VIFAVNRSEDTDIAFTFEEEGFGLESISDATELAGYDKKDTNATDHDLVKLKEKSDVELKDDRLSTVLKPLSWNVIRIKTK